MRARFVARSAASLGAMAGLVLIADVAQAQSSGGKIETVVVTAERRAENLQAASLAVTVLSADDIKQRNINTVDDLMRVTPSLTINNFGQGNDFNIRGIGKGESNIQTPSGVVTYRDGVPVLGGFVQEEPYYDIADIEVLRGPQGTFAGTNATGGSVSIKEKDPDFGALGGYAQGQVGNYGDVGLQGAVNVPISDNFAARFALNMERHDSFWTITKGAGFSGDPGRIQTVSGRVSFLWEPMQNLDVLFKTDVNYFDNGGYPADPANSFNDIFHIQNNAHNMAVDDGVRSVLDVKYTFDGGIVVRSLSGFQYGRASEEIDLDGTNAASLTFRDLGKVRIWSEELNLLSPDTGPFTWILGGFFQHEDDDLPAKGGFDIGVPAGIIDIVLTYHTPKQHEAVFGQITYDITDALQLQVGARFNNSTFDLKDHQETDLFGFPLPGMTFDVPCVGPSPACPATRNGHESDSKVTGKVALNWTANERNNFYVFFATGHKDGGQNTTSNEPALIAPEEVRNVEIGWKARLLDGHISTQLDGYWNDYKNFQVTFFDPNTATSPILNAPSAKTLGIEAQAQGTWDRFSFDANLAWEHSRFGGFFATPAAGQPLANLTGEQTVFTPIWTGNFGAQYAAPLRNGDTLIPRFDFAYVGAQWSSVFHSPGVRLGDRDIADVQLSYLCKDAWEITAYTTNLFDRHYVAAANVSLRYAGPPRQFGLRVSKSF